EGDAELVALLGRLRPLDLSGQPRRRQRAPEAGLDDHARVGGGRPLVGGEARAAHAEVGEVRGQAAGAVHHHAGRDPGPDPRRLALLGVRHRYSWGRTRPKPSSSSAPAAGGGTSIRRTTPMTLNAHRARHTSKSGSVDSWQIASMVIGWFMAVSSESFSREGLSERSVSS